MWVKDSDHIESSILPSAFRVITFRRSTCRDIPSSDHNPRWETGMCPGRSKFSGTIEKSQSDDDGMQLVPSLGLVWSRGFELNVEHLVQMGIGTVPPVR
ncbi:hypothetical protein PDE_02658 [Penicillium oxalicum 114-2]|uniref:Uncharacterized protein n=1 Tax=Penicillium oxalicum (strain 114-2 / CGMCC 5302) TaxID=933388 RepID=S7ZBU8_PENO1|nr:hypothetical protein PDE_02658 [Penicillium oxalicum 114-2]